MPDALAKPMTLEAFLAWEERQELRYEFDGVQPRAMTGGTFAHGRIQFRLARALLNGLEGTACIPVGSEVKVRTANGIRYPDAFVVCSPIPPNATVAHDPLVFFEILSPSTANDDLGAKKAEYQAIPSVQSYVVLHQTHRAAQVFRRASEAEAEEANPSGWTYLSVFGVDAVIALPEIGVSLALAEIYDGVLPE